MTVHEKALKLTLDAARQALDGGPGPMGPKPFEPAPPDCLGTGKRALKGGGIALYDPGRIKK